jgi:apolipoprotein D and lipocalin family protein
VELTMNLRRHFLILLVAATSAGALSACATLQRGPVGNPAVPQPAKAVDLTRYAGLWYEAVTAEYDLRDDGLVSVLNTCRQGAVDGPVKTAQGRAKVVPGGDNAKLKVSFFGPFYLGDYWVLDRADDYSWSIVGEPSGRYLWLLSRTAQPSAPTRAAIMERAKALGYDLSLVREVRH